MVQTDFSLQGTESASVQIESKTLILVVVWPKADRTSMLLYPRPANTLEMHGGKKNRGSMNST